MKNILSVIGLLILLAACTQTGGGGQMSLAQSDKPRNANPSSSAAQQSQLVSGNTAFAFELYKQLGARQGNLFLSPYSISTALAMTQAGARGDTLAQMNKALHFTLPIDALHPALNALQLALNKREQNAQDASKKDFRLRVTNALWGEKTYSFKADFLDLLAENYGAGLRLVDFLSAPEPSRQAINQWVSDQTEQKIKDLLPQGSITNLTRLVLTNAIYFNANWMKPFYPENTKAGDFNLLDGKKTQAQLMSTSTQLPYARGSGYQAVELPYEGNKLSMLVVVPDGGKFTDIERSLDPDNLESIKKGLGSAQVNLQLPRFKFEASFGLIDALKALGMQAAFEPGKADLSGMDGTKNLYISAIEHKAYISVDEKGTEAAAATAVVVGLTSMPAQSVDLKIDRPFLFYILDKQSGALLFMGRVVNPG